MPVSRPADLPENGGGRWPHTGFRSVRWGDMEVGYTVAPPVDCTPAYQGLPGGVCNCPHYGYVFTGRLRAVYPGTDRPDEVATAGDVYFFPAGHSLVYEEDSEVLELNPAAALEALMDHFEAKMSEGWGSGPAGSAAGGGDGAGGYVAPDLSLVGEEHVARYRETGGEVGHHWNGATCLVLTTRGRHSGLERSNALIYGVDGDRYVVVASYGGAPTHPAWYHNLVADPDVDVQVGAERFRARARTAEGEEREALWAVMTAVWPNYDQYAQRTSRRIPVVVLERV